MPPGAVCSPVVQDNYPTLQLTVSDLSPFYLAEAKSNMEARRVVAACVVCAATCAVGAGAPYLCPTDQGSSCRTVPVGVTLAAGSQQDACRAAGLGFQAAPIGAGPAKPCCSLSCCVQYWKRMRAPEANFGGHGGSGVTFLQTAAERLSVPDCSQDIVWVAPLRALRPLQST